MTDRILQAKELNKGKGAISILTHNEITRIDLTQNAVVMALISHINGKIWKQITRRRKKWKELE